MIDHISDVLCRWIQVREFRSVQVKIFVVKFFNNFAFNNRLQYFSIHYIARLGSYFASYFYNQLVVMAMVVGIVAFTKYLTVFGIVPMRVIQAMSRVEMKFTVYGAIITAQ